MKKIITDFLFKRRFKPIKNRKGFSLLEVLVAVAIIAIISGIAVPQFLRQRENAAQVAADTSAGNIGKAFRQCRVLKTFGECDDLDKIGVSCPSGATCDDEKADPKFCAHLTKGQTATLTSGEFSVCISVSGSAEARTYGGQLMAGKQICQITQPSDCTTVSERGQVSNGGSIKYCTGDPDCSSHGTRCTGGSATATRSCVTSTTTGKCNASADCI